MKTAELTGRALDWAVAEAEGLKTDTWHPKAIAVLFPGAPRFVPFSPSRDWGHGGPIIEREEIRLRPDKGWSAAKYWPDGRSEWLSGPTLLTAAMRCYVASKLGLEVNVPPEVRT